MSEIKLIVNADDFGQSDGINRGIIRAYEHGIVTSASLMVRYPAALKAADYARNNPELGVGLHIDLGEWILSGKNWIPLYQVASWDDEKAVEDEIYKQLESFQRMIGKIPTHIDSHQHIHLRENLVPLFSSLAGKLNITLRRCSQHVNYCGDFYGQLTDGYPNPDAICVKGLKKIIAGLPAGITELACHPGLNNDIKTMYSAERIKEVETLCNDDILKTIMKSNIELCSFEKIPF